MMRVVSLILSIISLLVWWEIPMAVIILSAANGFIICKGYDSSAFCKINIALCVLGVCLAVWNHDLHIGLKMLEYIGMM